MNYFSEIKNLTDLIIASGHVKLITDLNGQIYEVYAQEFESLTFFPVSILDGKLLTDCSNLELVKKIFETIQMVNQSKKPALNLISFSSIDILRQIDCEVLPITDHKFHITLTLHHSEPEEKTPIGNDFELFRQIGVESFESNLHFLLDQTQDIWFAITESGKFVKYNHKFLDLIGYPYEFLESVALPNLLVKDQKKTIYSVLKKLSYHTSDLQNLIFISKSGKEIKTETNFINFKKGLNQASIIGIVKEIPGDTGVSFRPAEDQFIKIITRVPIPILLIDELSLEIFFSNPFAIDYFEYQDDELTRLNLFDLFPSSENHYLVSVIRKGGVLNLEANYSWRLITKRGLEKIARFLIQQIDYEDRKILMVIILNQEEDTKLNFIKEDTNSFNFVEKDLLLVRMTPDGIITQVNKNFGDLIGRPLRKIINRSFEENLFVEDYERIFQHFAKLTPQNPMRKNVNRMLTANGKTVWVEWTDRGIFKGDKLVEIYGLGKNITDTYQRDLLHQSMEQRFQALVENLPMVTYVIHAQTMYPLYISPQVEIFTGYTQEEFYRNPDVWLNAMHPDDAEKFFENLRDRIEKKITGPVEFRIYHKDGSLRWAEEIGSTITMPDGTLLFQGISRDVTARHNTREKLIYYSKFERLINEISLNLMNAKSENLTQILQNTVDELGKYMQVDRTYIFDFNDSDQTMSNTFEWCNEGITPQLAVLQNLPFSMFPWWMEKMEKNEEISLDTLDDIPPHELNTREILNSQEILSVMVVPMFNNGKASGFIGFDMVTKSIHWEKESIHLLRLASAMIVSTRERLDVLS
ncbi:MAG: hypothetical protein CVU41_13575 [Chloroflexi bacterium HGW-Chloroflexi-3]|nr:MAG: hypothetical protein CVU41_13575 [Chloroflexi bacterium HGW-Chloroflexi-3]